MNNLTKKQKKEFEELWRRICKNKASSIDGRMIWNVNDDDDPDDGWVYADETILDFIESTISQTKQELIEDIEKDLVEVMKKYGRTSAPKDKSLNNWKQGHDEAIFNVIGFFGYLTRMGIFRKTI